MVQLHARRAGIPPPRATKDVELVVDVAANHASVTSIASSLTRIGFEPVVPVSRKESRSIASSEIGNRST